MKERKGIIQRLEASAQRFGQPLPGIPIVEIMGDKRVLIENHRGVQEYLDHSVIVCVQYGCVRIEGCHLEISVMSSCRLVITGSIYAVKLERRTG